MLIHPWDAALAPAEWQDWLASTDRFGMLAVNNPRPGPGPAGGAHPLHPRRRRGRVAHPPTRPNPAWPHLEAAAEVRLAVIGDNDVGQGKMR